VSPHFYTELAELQAFAATLTELREKRAWTKHQDRVAAY
jgi:hypothetical protein